MSFRNTTADFFGFAIFFIRLKNILSLNLFHAADMVRFIDNLKLVFLSQHKKISFIKISRMPNNPKLSIVF